MKRADYEFIADVLLGAYRRAKTSEERTTIREAVERLEGTVGQLYAWIEYPWVQDELSAEDRAMQLAGHQAAERLFADHRELKRKLHDKEISRRQYNEALEKLFMRGRQQTDAIRSEFDTGASAESD
jgi:hypothetical protein